MAEEALNKTEEFLWLELKNIADAISMQALLPASN